MRCPDQMGKGNLFVLCRRIVRLCCVCCCRWCCVTPSPFPEDILGSVRFIVLKLIITLLSLGVTASCAYGMSKVDPKLVDSGLGVIDSTKVGQTYHFLAEIKKQALLCPFSTQYNKPGCVQGVANVPCAVLTSSVGPEECLWPLAASPETCSGAQ